jgi:signal transduction histidine kinase
MSGRLVELDRENRRLLEAERLSELGDVARGLAHSLRNPLNALGLSIERLGDRAASGASPNAAASAELVEGSRRQIRRIDSALRSFLALASNGAAPAEAIDLGKLCREVALEALQDGAAAGTTPRIEVESASPPESRPLVVDGVAAELKAILQALVVNAVEASSAAARDPAPAVRIRLRPRAGGGAVVEIADEGPGLPAAVRERLFEPHVTTKPHGSGMGLFLAHRLATSRYGGALRLDARSEGGTVAVLELGARGEGAGA